MIELKQQLQECINEDLLQVTLSNSKNREQIIKVRIKPVLLRNELFFQETSYIGEKVLHINEDRKTIIDKIMTQMSQKFKQIEIKTRNYQVTGLVSKKGIVTIKKKVYRVENQTSDFTHNRKKHYILEIGNPIPFLIDLGVMNGDGSVVHARYDKFKQINRFLEFIEDILPRLPKDREITIVDFGCGKSYLTFAMYYYLKTLKGLNIRIIGLDLKEDVIETCCRLKEQYGFEKLDFIKGDIGTYERKEKVDMVVTLHACDTATDYALAKAVAWSAGVILAVPCCQHELNGQVDNEMLQPVLKYGLLKERIMALFTDGIRAEILESMGYETQILEFINMEHTPKNILIRAVKVENLQYDSSKLNNMMQYLNVSPTLGELMNKNDSNTKRIT